MRTSVCKCDICGTEIDSRGAIFRVGCGVGYPPFSTDVADAENYDMKYNEVFVADTCEACRQSLMAAVREAVEAWRQAHK